MRIVIALGGNALLPKGAKGAAEDQLNAAKNAVAQIVDILKKNKVVLTHGNGPQVGNLLLQQSTNKEVPEMPLDVLDAMTQGQIGYFIASAISMTGLHSATLVTRVVVDENDRAFKNPTKPIGPFYDSLPKSTSIQNPKLKTGNQQHAPHYLMDAGRGYRLVVPSPEPIKIREHDAISALLEKGFVVIAVGGGGIPIKSNGEGLEAVIDKDNATSLLATQINAEMLVFVTSVNHVYLNFGKENQKEITKMNVNEAEEYATAGHFAEGSMKPKITSAIKFVKNGGKKAIICSIDNITDAINGKNGTMIAK